MKIRALRLLGTVSVALIVASIPPLDSSLHAGENEDFRFAGKLRRDEMFVAAAQEYLRFAERYSTSVLRPAALFNAGEAYMQAGKAVEALEVFEDLIEAYAENEYSCRARFQRGRVLKVLGRYVEAADEMLMVPENYADCPLVGRALLEAGECLISAGDFEQAARILRRIIGGGGNRDLMPRAMYSLALALSSTGRDLEAHRVLSELVDKHPSSPTAALALLKLADMAVAGGDTEAAEKYFRKVKDNFKEEPLQEKASLGLIGIHGGRGEDKALLEESERFIGSFPDSEHRGGVLKNSIDAAWRLGRFDKALSLVASCIAEEGEQDSTGQLHLIKGRILAEKGNVDEAIGELEDFRHNYTRSPLLMEVLLLEAGLYRQSGAPQKAAGVYQLALLEGAVGAERLSILTRLAEISVVDLEDTLAAIRYWDTIAHEDEGGEMAQEALWRAGGARERIGDLGGAAAAYEKLISLFPEGRLAEGAAEELRRLDLLPRWNRGLARKLARSAVSDAGSGERCLRVGIILLDDAGDAAGAVDYLEDALDLGLADSLVQKATYYLGKAYLRKHEVAKARGADGLDELKRAGSIWLSLARESVGTFWGGKAHRGYLELKFSDWKLHDRLSRLDEYLNYYGSGGGRWWALGRKVDFLYEAALSGESWAADSAMAICREMLAGDTPESGRAEVSLMSSYLMLMLGDLAGAARSFENFASRYDGDPRSAQVLYDLGETLIKLKDYRGAETAYRRCLGKRLHRLLEEKCRMRQGDCFYYMRRFKEAAGTYSELAEGHPDGVLTHEAKYREALAREWLGEGEMVGKILGNLLETQGLSDKLRERVLGKLGKRLCDEGKSREAEPLLAELVSLNRSGENLGLLARASLEAGEYKRAVEHYSDALKYKDADTCMVLAGRARAKFRLGRIGSAGGDLERLVELCPDHGGIPAVLLEKGIVEVEGGRCAEAGKTLIDIRTRYAGTDEAALSLYYLAQCDLKRGGYEEAAQKLGAFLRESPNSSIIDKAYFKLASAQFGAGNLNLAATNYALAAEAAGDSDLSLLALKNLGQVYQELEDWERAASAWQRVVELFPGREGMVEVLFNLGFCLGQSGRHEMAYEVYTRIPSVASNEEQQGRAHYWAGIALKELGRFSEAVREFLRVPYLRTGGMWGVTAKLEAGACYVRMGDLDQAESVFLGVISSHGEGSDWGRVARKELDRIKSLRDSRKDKGGGEEGGGLEESRGNRDRRESGGGPDVEGGRKG